MNIFRAENYEEMSKKASRFIAAQIILKPESVLGLATGTTPIGTYSGLVDMNKNDGLDFSGVKTVNLDEYKGLPRENDQSYFYFMNKHLFSQVNIDKDNTNLPDGLAEDGERECERYENLIKDLGGIDLQLLGIGHNGHIGFNEPDDFFTANTHMVKLTESTIEANSRLFSNKDEVPGFAYTMGIKAIMQAKRVLLIINGREKAEITRAALKGPVTPKVPASILQLHGDLTVIGDRDALSLI